MNFSWVIPGKLAGSQGPVIPEELTYLKGHGIRAMVRLEPRTTSGESLGLADLAEFVHDMHAPTNGQIDRIIAYMDRHIEAGSAVAVSCRAGYGRTGTVLACYLVHTGYSAGDAPQAGEGNCGPDRWRPPSNRSSSTDMRNGSGTPQAREG